MTENTSRSGPLGLAVVGAGYWGPNLVRTSAASGRFEPRWVCDRDLTRAERVAATCNTATATSDLAAVLADPRVDAVAVATPAGTHAEVALAAIAAGKHVLVEKPLSTSTALGRQLVDAARSAGVVLMCDHTYCYTPAVQAIRDMIAAGEVGEVLFVDSTRVNLGLIQPDVDVVWDLAPHDLAILDAVLPGGCRPTSVSAHGADPVGAGLACLAQLNLTLPGDLPVSLNLNWLSPVKVRRMMIGGSRRTIVWDDLNPAMRITVYDRGVEKLATVDDRTRRNVSYRIGDVIAPALPEREALVEVFATFAGAIVDGTPVPTDGEAGLRVLQVLEAAATSLGDAGRAVDPRGEAPVHESLDEVLRGAIPGQARRRSTATLRAARSGAA